MGIRGKSGESASATQTFDALTVDKRVLVTASRTIALANIATVSVGTHVERSPRIVWLALFLMCAAVAYAASPWSGFQAPGGLISAGAFAAAALLFLVLLVRPDDRRHYLIVASNDGLLSRFSGPDRRLLDEARRLLTDKINRSDETGTFSINFATGTIEGAAAAANGGRAVAAGGHPVTNGGPARQAPAEQSHGSPAGQFAAPVSQGGYLNGAPVADQQIDFARLIPVVVEMHRFYARQQGAEYLEKRLEELELLMRSGAATASQKSRIKELTRDLTQILHSYPQVVQVFSDIRGMTGP